MAFMIINYPILSTIKLRNRFRNRFETVSKPFQTVYQSRDHEQRLIRLLLNRPQFILVFRLISKFAQTSIAEVARKFDRNKKLR